MSLFLKKLVIQMTQANKKGFFHNAMLKYLPVKTLNREQDVHIWVEKLEIKC